MIKYAITAMGLKFFSSCSIMRRLYRFLGNTYGMKKRLNGDIPSYYIDRIKRILQLCSEYNVIKDGDKLLEIGTGWLHWEALTAKLFFDVEATLYDVWDNRQFDALKHYFSQLDYVLDHKIDISDAQRRRAHTIIKQILASNSLDTLYKQLGFQYVIESNGTLGKLPDQSFDVIVSGGVLEHVNRDILGTFIHDFYRVLRPGGYSIHSINIGDHLYAYDKNASPKEYLRFSDNTWKVLFENQVQYFNRVQRSEWLSLFDKAGLKIIEEDSEYSGTGSFKVHKTFAHLDKADINCTLLNISHQRPTV